MLVLRTNIEESSIQKQLDLLDACTCKLWQILDFRHSNCMTLSSHYIWCENVPIVHKCRCLMNFCVMSGNLKQNSKTISVNVCPPNKSLLLEQTSPKTVMLKSLLFLSYLICNWFLSHSHDMFDNSDLTHCLLLSLLPGTGGIVTLNFSWNISASTPWKYERISVIIPLGLWCLLYS